MRGVLFLVPDWDYLVFVVVFFFFFFFFFLVGWLVCSSCCCFVGWSCCFSFVVDVRWCNLAGPKILVGV